MIKHEIFAQGDKLHVEARQDLQPVALLSQFIKGLPPEQRHFFKECRVVAVLPHYLPKGDFNGADFTLRLDPEQLDWAIDRHPEFKACDDTANNHLATGGKIIVS